MDKIINEIFSVAGTVSNKILVFDIDDTLIYSNADVRVCKNGEVIKTLSSAEFNGYHLKPGETFDFCNFDSKTLLNQAKFTKYWDTLKREYAKGTHIAILTARSRPSMIRNFFLNNGIDIKKELIFCTGYSKFPYKGEVKYKKSKVIEQLHNMGYNIFVFFDDNEDNLSMVKSMEKLYNIKVNIVKAEI